MAAVTAEAVEAKFSEALAEMGSDPEKFARDATFEDLDVDSLDLVELAQIVEEEFGVELRGDDVKDVGTVGAVIDLVVARGG